MVGLESASALMAFVLMISSSLSSMPLWVWDGIVGRIDH